MSIHHHTRDSSIIEFSKSDSDEKARSVIESLSLILDPLPPSLTSSENPAFSLLHDPQLAKTISWHLRQPDSGAGDNNLCRWLYDTFQSSDPNLQIVVLRFLPIIAGIYLSRAVLRKPLAGFEAILLALYAHETTFRGGQPITVNVPDLSHSSLYHETRAAVKNNSTNLNLAILSPSLEPHGTVRSTKRARIVGVALELYYSRISLMPISSKIEFCEFCVIWAGLNGDMFKEDENHDEKEIKEEEEEEEGGSSSKVLSEGTSEDVGEEGSGGTSTSVENVVLNNSSSVEENCEKKEGRIPLPWELLQPALRVLGHCLMGPMESKELKEAARAACRSLYARALHDVNSQAILATGSLLKIGNMPKNSTPEPDPTEISDFNNPIITL
ncbi:Hyccin [Macleaya cordata]|uniref:Hyccin n=1 Tax=Macleaya cordata TaxID=56857 RepID=A0A200Q0F5_MACCD|nr:Hyccin [Macleaya cordata]